MIKFLTSTRFLIHTALALLVASGVIWAMMSFLNYYTLHGETIAVPDLTGLTVDEMQEVVEEKKLRFQVVDSTFAEGYKKGAAYDQDPPPESLVKQGRTIYVTLNAFHPPRIPMPRLLDISLRSVIIIAENRGIKLGKFKYIPDLCRDCVLRQLYKGKDIEEGELIPKGAVIDLVLGQGFSDEKIRIPLVIDLTLDSAIRVLQEHSLNLGIELYDSTYVKNLTDSLNARVYMQKPDYSKETYLRLGSTVDLWLTTDSTKIDTKLWDDYVKDTTIFTNSANDTTLKDNP